MESLLKADDKKLNEYLLLSNGKFNIPYTQRPYEWNVSQVERLFWDIIAIYEDKKEQHILNFITIYLDEDHQNIFDGQQRTVTLLLFICVVIHKLEHLGDKKNAEKLKEEFIKKDDWRSNTANNTKIVFGNSNTNHFFNSYIIEDDINSIENITDQEKGLQRNYNYLKDKLDEYFDKCNLTVKDLLNIVEKMTEKMYVIILETPNEDIANQMFETLNNTGKKLVDFYVLKNKCIKVTSESLTAKYWDEIEANTDLLNKNQFLTQFTSLFNGKTSSQKAFESLEKHQLLSSENKVEYLLSNMEQVSRYFLELHEPERRKREKDSKKDLNDYSKLVEGLKTLKASQYRPVILAMNSKKYSLRDINKVLSVCLNIQIRNIFFARHKANTLEKFYPDLAKEIFEADTNDLEFVLEKLNSRILDDKETLNAIKNREITKNENKIIRFILKKIYDFENDQEITINGDTQHVNLEHILPQKPSDNSKWLKIFKKSEIDKYKYSLGNLTLILGKKNTSLGNDEFEEKRTKMKDSNILQNREIAKNKEWTHKEIEDRTSKLAEKIISIWKKK